MPLVEVSFPSYLNIYSVKDFLADLANLRFGWVYQSRTWTRIKDIFVIFECDSSWLFLNFTDVSVSQVKTLNYILLLIINILYNLNWSFLVSFLNVFIDELFILLLIYAVVVASLVGWDILCDLLTILFQFFWSGLLNFL